jgi:hypothetical protein
MGHALPGVLEDSEMSFDDRAGGGVIPSSRPLGASSLQMQHPFGPPPSARVAPGVLPGEDSLSALNRQQQQQQGQAAAAFMRRRQSTGSMPVGGFGEAGPAPLQAAPAVAQPSRAPNALRAAWGSMRQMPAPDGPEPPSYSRAMPARPAAASGVSRVMSMRQMLAQPPGEAEQVQPAASHPLGPSRVMSMRQMPPRRSSDPDRPDNGW